MDTLESFYRAHYRVVYRYLLSLCGNRSVAEDLASETFLRAIRHIERYDGTCKPTTWLCQIGKNLWLNECRRQRRLVPLEDTLEAALPSPEDALAGREALRAVFAAAQTLPTLQRQVFLMRLEGLSHREIGAALGRSETWARVTFFRAKGQILERMEGRHGTL